MGVIKSTKKLNNLLAYINRIQINENKVYY